MSQSKYMAIAQEIKKRIISQQYQHGEPLPDQFKLADEFHTSRMTIQRAIQQLIIEGTLYTRQGQGTFVRKNFLQLSQWDSPVTDYFGATKKWEGIGKVTSEVIKFDIRFPTDKEQSCLLIDADMPIYDLIRLRFVNAEPVSLDYTLMPLKLIPNLTKDILQKSIFSYIQQDLGLKILGSYRIIRAMKPNDYEQRYLNCKEHDPVLEVEQIIYLDDGTPLEYAHCRYRYDHGGIIVVNNV
ncbi:GntR family transcriptional regulator [Acerihabitans arboris]|uniref:UTRA domain-containing protein n=1 Tax=Acerihabitans arboris TaxID=2691583 RepID=A0A845ST57_9GAMM|nr:GntR family transcriptional regulator [Acerihabitans arboris]NDL66016.1 UTRA domain-containing protein [Acerihabitans arboris]